MELPSVNLTHCPTCKRPIEYEPWGQGMIKIHTETGKFNCPEED